jgi:hypothetical protein
MIAGMAFGAFQWGFYGAPADLTYIFRAHDITDAFG